MESFQTVVPIQSNLSAPENAETPKHPRNGKLAKIKRKETSCRPGRSEESASAKPSGVLKRLMFKIPSATNLSSPDEAGEVQKIATALNDHHDNGKVASFSFQGGYWEIAFALTSNTIAEDEDEILSEVFRDLMPTINAMPNLCNGFRTGAKPSWEYRVGANLLDHGNLN